MWSNMKITFYLKDLNITLATREFAKFAVQEVKRKDSKEISLAEIESASRSFLDELYILAQKENMNLIDIPEHIRPLFNIIKKSHQDQVLYAPSIRVKISDKTFA